MYYMFNDTFYISLYGQDRSFYWYKWNSDCVYTLLYHIYPYVKSVYRSTSQETNKESFQTRYFITSLNNSVNTMFQILHDKLLSCLLKTFGLPERLLYKTVMNRLSINQLFIQFSISIHLHIYNHTNYVLEIKLFAVLILMFYWHLYVCPSKINRKRHWFVPISSLPVNENNLRL